MNSVGKNIKLLRKQSSMSQDELAEKIHVTRQTISNYETGKSNPDIEMLMLITQEFGVDMNVIVYGPLKEARHNKEKIKLLFWTIMMVGYGIILVKAMEGAKSYARDSFDIVPEMLLAYIASPILYIIIGWILTKAMGLLFRIQSLQNNMLQRICWLLFILLGFYFVLALWNAADWIWMDLNRIQIMKVSNSFSSDDIVHIVPSFIAQLYFLIFIKITNYKFLFIFPGIAIGGYNFIRIKQK